MEMILSIVMAIVTIVFAGAIIIAAISFFKKKKDDEPYKIDFKVIFRIYYYIIMFASVVSIGVGLTLTIKSLFSKMFGLDFSYTQQTVYEEVPEKYVEGEEIEYEYEYEKDVDKKDLISGLSYLFVATPILLLHIWGLKQLEKKDGENYLMKKIYLIVCLVVFALVGIISLPVGVYQTLQFFLTEQGEHNWNAIVPGEYLAVALSFVPIWVVYLVNFNKVVSDKD